MGWSGLNVSAWLVWVLRGAWLAEPVVWVGRSRQLIGSSKLPDALSAPRVGPLTAVYTTAHVQGLPPRRGSWRWASSRIDAGQCVISTSVSVPGRVRRPVGQTDW